MKPGPKVKGPPVKRACLRCFKSFTARGLFNRICPACKKNERAVSKSEDYRKWGEASKTASAGSNERRTRGPYGRYGRCTGA